MAHPDLLTRMAEIDALPDQGLATTDTLLAGMVAGGLSPTDAGSAFQQLMAYTVGSVMMAIGTQVSDASVAEKMVVHKNVMAAGLMLDSRTEFVFTRGIEQILKGYGFELP